MTEADWNASTDPQAMLEGLDANAKPSDRKLRLFAVVCCRRLAPLLTDERSRKAVGVAEAYADGLAGDAELEAARNQAASAVETRWFWRAISFKKPTLNNWGQAAKVVLVTTQPDAKDIAWEVLREGCNVLENVADLLRDIFSSPSIEPFLLSPPIVKLAQAIYDERAFDRMPALADALEQAGCREPEILGHCRSAGEHVRGCFVTDLILGK